MNSVELRDRRALIKHELDAIIGCAEMEIRELKPYEQEIYDARIAEIESINEQLRALGETTDISTDEEVDVHTLIAKINERKKNNNTHNNNIMEKRFSLLEAVRSIALNQPLDEVTSKVVADTAMQMRNHNLSFNGQLQIPIEQRELTVATEGEHVVATDMFDLVMPLQKKSRLIEAGCQLYSGLVGDVQIPLVGNVNSTFLGEVAEANPSDVTFEHVTLKPKRLSCVIPVSKQFLMQSSFAVEQKLRELITRSLIGKIEETALGDEAGTAEKYAGLLNGAAPTTISTFADLVALESELEDVDNAKYLISAKAKAALRAMAKSTKSTQLVFEDGSVDGTDALVSTYLKDKTLVYGDFGTLAMGVWGSGMDILVDPYTLAGKGMVRLVASIYVDFAQIQKEAIKVASIA